MNRTSNDPHRFMTISVGIESECSNALERIRYVHINASNTKESLIKDIISLKLFKIKTKL